MLRARVLSAYHSRAPRAPRSPRSRRACGPRSARAAAGCARRRGVPRRQTTVTPFWRARPVTLVNARVVSANTVFPSLRFTTRILSVGEAPRRGDAVVDLDGAFVLPGLVNAHD